jgi:putative ATPase
MIEEGALKFLADICDGDARIALNSLQLAFQSKMQTGHKEVLVTLDDIKEGIKVRRCNNKLRTQLKREIIL